MLFGLAVILAVALLALRWEGGQLGLALAPYLGTLPTAESRSVVPESARVQALERENEKLKGLLEMRVSRFSAGLAARVVARDPSTWFAEVAVDRGREDGVTAETVAVSPQGLVGRVSQVATKSARVRLLVAPGSAVPVMLASSGAVGILYGDGGYTCQIKFVSHDVTVKEGEAVLTSGLGQIYPGGLLVGHVIRNYGRTEALFQSLEVRPAVDFGRLRHVLLVTRQP